ncbi:MAG: GMC family oxidoreductase [Myxococcales bacterium]|nr:GMC family oxidoreductase [Myxococcales bacterium]
MSFFTGAAFDRDCTLDADVCVVGSGAGGAHVAQRLAAAGKRVVVLEAGGLHTSDTFDLHEANMIPRLYEGGGVRHSEDGSVAVLQGRAVGGTTVVNWTTCYRTPQRTFDHWAEHHGVTGPTSAALTPHFERVERRLGVEPVLLSQVNLNNRVIWEGARRLGWEAHLMRRNVKRCAQSGYCGMGCPVDAKQSMLVTMLPEAVRCGASVYANAHAERVLTTGRRVTSVIAHVHDPETDKPKGCTLTVRAACTVLSAGGINSPAILLRSGIDPNGRTGKRTFLHPVAGIIGEHTEEIRGFSGAPQAVGSQQFEVRGDRMGFTIEAAPVFPAGAAGFASCSGAALRALMARLSHLSITIAFGHDGFHLEDPDEGGTVGVDARGRPAFHYRWTPRLREYLLAANLRLAELVLAGGADRVTTLHTDPVMLGGVDQLSRIRSASFERLYYPLSSAHVMGGCAMGPDPDQAVVDDRDLRHHFFDNLFVIDGSVFPTSVGANPQLSIYALASWAAERLAQRFG